MDDLTLIIASLDRIGVVLGFIAIGNAIGWLWHIVEGKSNGR